MMFQIYHEIKVRYGRFLFKPTAFHYVTIKKFKVVIWEGMDELKKPHLQSQHNMIFEELTQVNVYVLFELTKCHNL